MWACFNFILYTMQLIHWVTSSLLAVHCMEGSLQMLPLPENKWKNEIIRGYWVIVGNKMFLMKTISHKHYKLKFSSALKRQFRSTWYIYHSPTDKLLSCLWKTEPNRKAFSRKQWLRSLIDRVRWCKAVWWPFCKIKWRNSRSFMTISDHRWTATLLQHRLRLHLSPYSATFGCTRLTLPTIHSV